MQTDDKTKYPFYFYRDNEDGSRDFLVVIAHYDITTAFNQFGVSGGRLGDPESIWRPDIDIYGDKDIHTFATECEARKFIAEWWNKVELQENQ